MPLTPSEKMRRYREKLKKDPIRYEEYKQKDLNRIKLKNKKITELSEKEKENQRKKWRMQKKRQKEKKTESTTKMIETEKASTSTETPTTNNKCVNKNHILTIRRLRRKYETAISKNNLLCRNIEKIRKKMYRLKQQNSKNIKNLEDTINKMKAREEVMENALRIAYKSENRSGKRVLKSVASTDVVKKNKCKTYVANLLGLQGRVRILKSIRKRRSDEINEDLKSFFMRDDISRSTSGKKECKTVNKEKHQIRYLTDKLFNLYQIYRNEGGRFKFTTFFRHKPKYVLSPNIHNRDTCLCIKHSNMDMLFSSLLRNGVFSQDIKSLTDVISKITCDLNSFDCMYGKCTVCNQSQLIYALEGESLSKGVFWHQWEKVNHKYEKVEKGKIIPMITKKTVKNHKLSTLRELIQIFEKNIKLYKIHIFNWKHQQLKYREKITNLRSDEALILCDFSENYECKSCEEVQAIHFGASKSQVTLHCGMIYWSSGSQSFCSISDSKCHEPGAIWAHLLPVIKLLLETHPVMKRLHFFSDGPSSQYRQKKNFFLLKYYTKVLDMDLCTWNFSESGHGKGVADGIGGSVKRTLDKQVAYGRNVTNGNEAFDILKSVSKRIDFFFIEESEIQLVQSNLPLALKAIPGTLQLHQIVTFRNLSYIQHRVLSCFCKIDKDEVCECFELKKHLLPDLTVNETPDNLIPSTSMPSNPVDTENIPIFLRHDISSGDLIQFPTHDSISINEIPDNLIPIPSPSKTSSLADIENIPGCIPYDSTSVDLIQIPNIPIILKHNEELGDLDNIQLMSELAETDIPDLSILLLNESCPIECENIAENECKGTSVVSTPSTSTSLIEKKHSLGFSDSRGLHEEEVIEKRTPFISVYPRKVEANMENNLTDGHKNEDNDLQKVLSCNIINKPHKRHASSTYQTNQLKKIRITGVKENKARNSNPSIRTVVSRSLQCFACKKNVKFTTAGVAKCMECKMWFCVTCTEGQNCFDYLCCRCLGEDYL